MNEKARSIIARRHGDITPISIAVLHCRRYFSMRWILCAGFYVLAFIGPRDVYDKDQKDGDIHGSRTCQC